MEQQEFLIGFAQLSLVLTGFVSIFIIFLIGGEQKSRVNTHHAASIMIGSIVATLSALIPIILYNYGYTGDSLWWWSSALLLALGAANFFIMGALTLQLNKQEFKEAGYVHMIVSYGLGLCATGLLVYNVFGQLHVGHYILAAILIFCISVIGFVTFAAQKILYW